MQNLQTALKDKSTLIFDKEDFALLKQMINYSLERNANKQTINTIFNYFAKTQTIECLSKVKANGTTESKKKVVKVISKPKQNKKG